MDFSSLEISLQEASEGVEAVSIRYVTFTNTILDVLIIAFAIFRVVKAMNAAQKEEEAAPPEPSEDVVLLREIRDSLRR